MIAEFKAGAVGTNVGKAASVLKNFGENRLKGTGIVLLIVVLVAALATALGIILQYYAVGDAKFQLAAKIIIKDHCHRHIGACCP